MIHTLPELPYEKTALQPHISAETFCNSQKTSMLAEFDKAQSFMSVLSALQVVRESEIKAYNFYKKMSESSTDSEVKRFFIELMEEEDEHRKMVEDQINKLDESNEPLRDKDDIEEPNGL